MGICGPVDGVAARVLGGSLLAEVGGSWKWALFLFRRAVGSGEGLLWDWGMGIWNADFFGLGMYVLLEVVRVA